MGTFSESSLVQSELRAWRDDCKCAQQVEARRKALHAANKRVLVADMRFFYNGVGNSLVRWLAVLRFGLAAGRATYLWRSNDVLRLNASARQQKTIDLQLNGRQRGIDLGYYFRAIGGDYRWSPKTRRRVSAAMAASNITYPHLAIFSCLRMTWCCTHMHVRIGRMGAGGRLDESHPVEEMYATHEDEVNGLLLNWFAARTEPWIILSMRNFQTAFEQSAGLAGIVSSTGWPAALLSDEAIRSTLPFGGKGACLNEHDARSDASTWNTKSVPSTGPTIGYQSDRLSSAPWAVATRMLVDAKQPLRGSYSRTCAYFSMLRPQRVLKNELVKFLPKLDTMKPLIGMHIRSGFADWQRINSRHARNNMVPDASLSHAMAAKPLTYAQHWRKYESMLLDCHKSPQREPGAPCFEWQLGLKHGAPTLHDAMVRCRGRRFMRGDFFLKMPSDGVLAAAVGCAVLFGQGASKPEGAPWGILAMGDSPGFISLVRSHPQLKDRVVDTSASGVIGHTSFDSTCDRGKGARKGVCADADDGATPGSGAWTRAMVDYYLGGLTSGFVTVLFSSWGSAMLQRSLLCCSHNRRMHLGAMYNRSFSHRDRPMRHELFLQAITQSEEYDTEISKWR